jgi:replicative DNA helicase
MVCAVAESLQIPIDAVALFFLAVAATALAKVYRVRISSDWAEPLNLYTVSTLPPGSRKSAMAAQLHRVLRKFEEHWQGLMREEIARSKSAYTIAEGRLKRLQGEAAKAEGAEREGAEMLAQEAAAELARLKVRELPRLLCQDISTERLGIILGQQGGRIAILNAEGGVFELMAGKYTEGSTNFELYLQAHAGDLYIVDRVSRATVRINEPALTLGLSVQPDVIQRLADRPEFRGRGLLGRFLYAMPVSRIGERDIETPPVPEAVRDEYENRITELLSRPLVKNDDDEIVSLDLIFHPQAERRLTEFRRWLEPQLHSIGALGGIQDWGGKLAGAVARIAGILHLLDHTDSPDPHTIPVALTIIERAIQIGHFLIPHALEAFGEMAVPSDETNARVVLEWIRKREAPQFTRKELHESLRGRAEFKKIEALQQPLDLLIQYGYIRFYTPPRKKGPGKPPGAAYQVNPHFLAAPRAEPPRHQEVLDL